MDIGLPAELLTQLKAIELRARRFTNTLFAGAFTSAFKGRGMRFEQVREYQPGDDVRHIDWHVTARMRAPYIKEFREERELTVMLLVDISASQRFGSQRKLKSEMLTEIAAVLAYTAMRGQDRVGLMLFADEVEQVLLPKKSPAHVWRLIRTLLTYQARHRGTDLATALQRLCQVVRQRAVVFVLSDFLTPAYEAALLLAARRHDITAIVGSDAREASLPAVGCVALQDCESLEVFEVDTHAAALRAQFAAAAQQRAKQRQASFLAAAIPSLHVDSQADYLKALERFLRYDMQRWPTQQRRGRHT